MRTRNTLSVAILFIFVLTLHATDMAVAQVSGAVETFSIQVTAIWGQADADAHLKALAAQSIAGKSSLNKRGYTVVYFGKYANYREARREAVKLKAKGKIKNFYVISSNSLVLPEAQVKKTPAKETSRKEAPATGTPAEATFAKATPAEATPTKEATQRRRRLTPPPLFFLHRRN